MNQTASKRFTSVALATALALMGLALPPTARAEVITNDKIPVVIGVIIPCSGDVVLLTGNLHVLITTEVDANGGIHLKSHFQPQGISGIGAPSGDKYQGTGVTQAHTNIHPNGAFEDTFVNNYRIIGQGKGNNLLLHTTIHVTVNANGDVTANVLNASAECK